MRTSLVIFLIALTCQVSCWKNVPSEHFSASNGDYWRVSGSDAGCVPIKNITADHVAHLIFLAPKNDKNCNLDSLPPPAAVRKCVHILRTVGKCIMNLDSGPSLQTEGPFRGFALSKMYESLKGMRISFSCKTSSTGRNTYKAMKLDDLPGDVEGAFGEYTVRYKGGEPASSSTGEEKACDLNSDCPKGSYCKDGRCKVDCVSDRDCPQGKSCDTRNGVCVDNDDE